jgi:hypothetical protein
MIEHNSGTRKKINKHTFLKYCCDNRKLLSPCHNIMKSIAINTLGYQRWKELATFRTLRTEDNDVSVREFQLLVKTRSNSTTTTTESASNGRS